MKNNTSIHIPAPIAPAFLDAHTKIWFPKKVYSEFQIQQAKATLKELSAIKNKDYWQLHLVRVNQEIINSK